MQKVISKKNSIKEKLRKCDQKVSGERTCEAQFDSPIDLVKHLRVVHKFPETHSPLIAAAVVLQGPDYRSLDGEHVFMKIAPYKQDRFCILHVVEYKFWVRIWVTEADPSRNPREIVPIKITVPAPDLDKNTQQDYLNQFTGRMLPFGTYTFKSDVPVKYFDVPKTFLRQFYEKRADGLFGLRILFAIGMFDAKEVFKENEEKLAILQVQQEEGTCSGGNQGETEAKNGSSGSKEEEDDDDDQEIVRPFCEIYD